MWKQWRPVILIALAVGFGYSMLRHGLMTRGFFPALSSTVRTLPLLGSQFRGHTFSSGRGSYSYSAPARGHRRHGKRHGHSGRRHHRRHR